MAKLVIVCILIAGTAVATIFSGIFFVKLLIDEIRERKANKKEEPKEELLEPAVEEKKEEVEEIDLDAMLATLEKRAQENEQKEVEAPEAVEEPKEEVAEKPAEEEKTEEVKQDPVVIVVNNESEDENLNYEERLAKAKEAFAKLEKDYNKNTKALNRYKRTERKKAKNEKLLNKKAAELASLNLSVYNVKDLKDVDPDKKAKQEELTTHVAELKAAIVEADEYLTANREKHNQQVKMNTYLEKEYARYQEEIKSLEDFLAKKDSDAE